VKQCRVGRDELPMPGRRDKAEVALAVLQLLRPPPVAGPPPVRGRSGRTPLRCPVSRGVLLSREAGSGAVGAKNV
jgi:hypothetical protein